MNKTFRSLLLNGSAMFVKFNNGLKTVLITFDIEKMEYDETISFDEIKKL